MSMAVAECDYERFFDGEDDERHYYWHRKTVRMILRNPASGYEGDAGTGGSCFFSEIQ